jgi:acetylornithine aminotransferase/acetylornithine/N-succinyldiaminopimelate aminotransferase
MSAGIAVLKTIIDDGLLDNAAAMGEYFLSGLRIIKDEFGDAVRDVRGKGLILGIEFVNPETAKDAVNRCIGNGLLTLLTEQKVMRILPPLIVSKSEIDQALRIVRKSLKEVKSA